MPLSWSFGYREPSFLGTCFVWNHRFFHVASFFSFKSGKRKIWGTQHHVVPWILSSLSSLPSSLCLLKSYVLYIMYRILVFNGRDGGSHISRRSVSHSQLLKLFSLGVKFFSFLFLISLKMLIHWFLTCLFLTKRFLKFSFSFAFFF